MDNLTSAIKAELDAAANDEASALQHYIEAGKLLATKKKELKHGEWLPYLDSIGVNRKTAHLYMSLAANVQRIRHLTSLNEAIAVIRGAPVKPKPKASKSGHVPWTEIARDEGALSANPGGAHNKLRDRVEKIDPTITIVPRKGVPEAQVPRLREVLRKIVIEDKPRARRVTTKAKDTADAEAADLSNTAANKLASAIRAAKRVLDLEYAERLANDVKAELEPMLETYRAENAKHKAVVNAYTGVLTKGEYKLVLGLLHTDKLPGLDALQKARYDKGFAIIKDKQFELCGLDKSEKLTSTLPKTVADLMAMRKK